jgi:Apoptosis regulator proteins, Bcl-2 family
MSLFICYICGGKQFPSYLSFRKHMKKTHWKSGIDVMLPPGSLANYQLMPPSDGSWTLQMARFYIKKSLGQDCSDFPRWHPTFANINEACALYEELYRRRFDEPIEKDLQLTADNVEDTFYFICDELFRYDGRITGARIVAMFVAAGSMARHPNLRPFHGQLLAKALAEYIDIVLMPWIRTHGDWVINLVFFYPYFFVFSSIFIFCIFSTVHRSFV